MIWWIQRQEAKRWAQEEAAERVRAEERATLFARGSFVDTWEHCAEGWRESLSFHHGPSALAWTRRGLDGYFLEGNDMRSWRQLRCDAAGVRKGPRIAHPLLTSLVEALPESGADQERFDDEAWSTAITRLAALDDPQVLAVELLRRPGGSAVVMRTWRGAEALDGGATATVEPPDAPPFALLVAEPAFPFAPGAAPPAPHPLRSYDFRREPEAAFDVVEKALPDGARISEMRIDETGIDLRIEHPTPDTEAKTVDPYGDMEFDEYGIPGASWWYPREEASFGCAVGVELADVRAAYFAAAKSVQGKLHWAWFSCSPAFTDEKRGRWHLVDDRPSS